MHSNKGCTATRDVQEYGMCRDKGCASIMDVKKREMHRIQGCTGTKDVQEQEVRRNKRCAGTRCARMRGVQEQGMDRNKRCEGTRNAAGRRMRRNKAPLNSLYVDVAALEQDEAEVSRMAAYTIALNKDKLAALHARKQLGGAAGPAGNGGHPGMVPGKGLMLGSMCTVDNGGSWMHVGPNPRTAAHAYNGRDLHQDTSSPFHYPTRVRPARQAHVSARGARPMEVSTSAKDAPLVVTRLAGSSGRMEQPVQGVSSSQTTTQPEHSSLSISAAAVKEGLAEGPHQITESRAPEISSTDGRRKLPHTGRLDFQPTSTSTSSDRRARVLIDPTAKVDVSAPLTDSSKPEASGGPIGGGSHHLPMPSGQQRPVRGRQGAGGNAAPLGSLHALSHNNAANFSPRRGQGTKQQHHQQQQQQQQHEAQPQHETQPPILQHEHEEEQQPLFQQPSLPGLGCSVHENLQESEHYQPTRAHESTAIAGLEHCYRGGPTPLGPGRVGNGQGGKPGGLAVPRMQASTSPLGWERMAGSVQADALE
ncbi:hypothetical protein DUNSADRAFT_12884 [Dunaliella salina]|uniref:Encoded protein n=1 Tax=Dunaliella salina TaxID=3046 RepID=A0ABQ7H3R2_DUNSA|nr:hypothetical protein DUNSADRAFT_12884 [Dunaliella salina]|eukprot:KAF5841441.1 hypothetical protein DUNSADRAFT_12884 [Dunaliella salina]